MLAGHGVVFTHHHFLGHGPGVLFGHVKKASVSGAVEADLDGGWLSHGIGSG